MPVVAYDSLIAAVEEPAAGCDKTVAGTVKAVRIQ